MRLRLEKREPISTRARLALPFAAVAISFALSFILILIARANPFTAFYYIFYGALGSRTGLAETAVKATPLLLTGLAAAVAFKARFYNLGGEGQLCLGALCAAVLGVRLALPRAIAVPTIVAAGCAAGAAWALLAGLLKTRLKVDEVVVTLLSNYIVICVISALLDGPLKDPRTMWPNSAPILDSARYPLIVPGTRLHAGALVAVAAAGALWWVMRRSVLGFEIAAVGANPRAAAYAGIPVGRTVILVSLLSGGLAGLAGAGEVVGLHYNLVEKISPNYGYAGVVIAMLGGLDPFGVVCAAILFGVLVTGAELMSRYTGVPVFLADALQGIVLLVMCAVFVFTRCRVRVSRGGEESPVCAARGAAEGGAR